MPEFWNQLTLEYNQLLEDMDKIMEDYGRDLYGENSPLRVSCITVAWANRVRHLVAGMESWAERYEYMADQAVDNK